MISKIIGDTEGVPKTLGYKIIKGLITLADEEEACTKPKWAYRFALVVRGANIEKCCEGACKDPKWAYWFAYDIPGADIEKCQEAACKDPRCAYLFAKYISGADIGKCRKVCKGTEYAF